jgi:hypothetical protein
LRKIVQYYLGEWHHEFPDEPVWMAYEVGDDLWVTRMIEHFPDGRTEFRKGADVTVDVPFDLEEFDPPDPDMPLVAITATKFEALWADRP